MTVRAPIPAKLRWKIFARDQFTCAYCGGRPPEVALHLDHRLAVVKGGSNEEENLVTACETCNCSKGAGSLPKDDAPKNAARSMLMEGLASPSEVAQLAGISRQLMNAWCADIDWRKARKRRLVKDWRAKSTS